MKGTGKMLKMLLGGILLLAFAIAGHAATQTWTKLVPTGVPPQPTTYGASTVYDSATNRLILFGGRTESASNDVWVLTNADGTGTPQWIKLSPTGGPPTARNNHTAVYDAINNRMIIFGGCMFGCTPILNDAWILSNANGLGGTPAWTQLSTTGSPTGRNNHKAAYDPLTNRMIVFGGHDGGGTLSTVFEEVWVLTNANGLDAGTPTWSLLSPTGAPASGTIGYYIGAMVYDSASNRMTIFGGTPKNPPATSTERNGVWVLSNANGLGGVPAWTNTVAQDAAGSPPNQTGGAFVNDTASNTATLYNFLGSPTTPRTWTLSHVNGLAGTSAWTEIFPGAGSPGSPHLNATAYNAANKRIIVYTNSATQANANEVWVLGTTTTTTSSADCFFDWAETAYSQYFAPAHPPSQTLDVYYYRHYSGTNAYLGVANDTQHAVYVGPASGGGLLDLGDLSTWLGNAGCPATQPVTAQVAGSWILSSTTGPAWLESQTLAFNSAGTLVSSASGCTFNATYTLSGSTLTFTVSSNNGGPACSGAVPGKIHNLPYTLSGGMLYVTSDDTMKSVGTFLKPAQLSSLVGAWVCTSSSSPYDFPPKTTITASSVSSNEIVFDSILPDCRNKWSVTANGDTQTMTLLDGTCGEVPGRSYPIVITLTGETLKWHVGSPVGAWGVFQKTK